MVLRMYGLLWVLVALAAGLTVTTGYFSELGAIVFGFIFSTLLFLGIVAVLPSVVGRHHAPKYQRG